MCEDKAGGGYVGVCGMCVVGDVWVRNVCVSGNVCVYGGCMWAVWGDVYVGGDVYVCEDVCGEDAGRLCRNVCMYE